MDVRMRQTVSLKNQAEEMRKVWRQNGKKKKLKSAL